MQCNEQMRACALLYQRGAVDDCVHIFGSILNAATEGQISLNACFTYGHCGLGDFEQHFSFGRPMIYRRNAL
jgi:hypothetical protein